MGDPYYEAQKQSEEENKKKTAAAGGSNSDDTGVSGGGGGILGIVGDILGTNAGHISVNTPMYNPQGISIGTNTSTGGKVDTSKYDNAAAAANARVAPTSKSATIDTTKQSQFRDAQGQLLTDLQRTARGQGTSAAQLTMMQALNRQIAAQRSNALGAKGVSPAQALRMANQGVGAATADIASQGAAAKAQEMEQAQKEMAAIAEAGRGQDLTLAGQQAGLNQQTALANQQAALQQQQLNDSLVAKYMEMGLSKEQAQAQADIALAQIRSQQQLGTNQLQTEIAQTNLEAQTAGQNAIIGAGGTIGGAIATKSDKNAKKDIKEASDKDKREFLDALKAFTFKAKDGYENEIGKGTQMGMIAQRLEKSKLANNAVEEDAKGEKVVNPFKVLMSALSTISNLDERLSDVEKSKRA